MVDDQSKTKIDIFEINKAKKLWQYGVSLRKRTVRNLFSFNIYILKPFYNDSSKLICCGHLQSPPFVLCCSKNTPETQQKLKCYSNETIRESSLFVSDPDIKLLECQTNTNINNIDTMIKLPPSLELSNLLNETTSPHCVSQIALPPFIDGEDNVTLTPITPINSESTSVFDDNNLNINITEYEMKVKRMREDDYLFDFNKRKRIELDYLGNSLESLTDTDYQQILY